VKDERCNVGLDRVPVLVTQFKRERCIADGISYHKQLTQLACRAELCKSLFDKGNQQEIFSRARHGDHDAS
jgi:hypothetical protein